MIELNSTQLNEKINSGEKFVVDFYATWCGPCKYLSKILEQHGHKFGVPVYKFDIETDRDISIKYNVRSVPTLKLFYEGNPTKSHVGLLSDSEFNNFANL